MKFIVTFIVTKNLLVNNKEISYFAFGENTMHVMSKLTEFLHVFFHKNPDEDFEHLSLCEPLQEHTDALRWNISDKGLFLQIQKETYITLVFLIFFFILANYFLNWTYINVWNKLSMIIILNY